MRQHNRSSTYLPMSVTTHYKGIKSWLAAHGHTMVPLKTGSAMKLLHKNLAAFRHRVKRLYVYCLDPHTPCDSSCRRIPSSAINGIGWSAVIVIGGRGTRYSYLDRPSNEVHWQHTPMIEDERRIDSTSPTEGGLSIGR